MTYLDRAVLLSWQEDLQHVLHIVVEVFLVMESLVEHLGLLCSHAIVCGWGLIHRFD